MPRTIILMMDSLGIGYSDDADKFGDVGADTFGHIAAYCGPANRSEGHLHIPNLSKLGFVSAAIDARRGKAVSGVAVADKIIGAYGYAAEISNGKDTPSGHWEIAGVPVLFDWGYFPEREPCFDLEFMIELAAKSGVENFLGKKHASGTEIIAEYGEEHMRTGWPIIYTSADSVFQIAAHEETFGLQRLYDLCQVARDMLDDQNIGRIIARPFIGDTVESFVRTGNRKDLSVLPPDKTLLDYLCEAGGEVRAIGKIGDIYAHQGISQVIKATGNDALFATTLDQVQTAPDQSLIFTNFVDFDSSYGHRRNPLGYGQAIEEFDKSLSDLFPLLREDDLVLITADHGCDPTWHGSDHTREFVPVVFFGPVLEKKGVIGLNLGKRTSFADMGQTIASHMGLAPLKYGTACF